MKVLIYDDHKLYGDSLRVILLEREEIQACDFVCSEDIFFQKIKQEKYDIVLLDLNLKGSSSNNGFQVLEKIMELYSVQKVIVVTSYDMPLYKNRALRIGASDFVNKSIEIDELLKVIQRVNSGYNRKFNSNLEILTGREVQILQEISTGATKKDIAKKLFIGERTLYNHIQSIYSKLEVNNALEAYNKAIELGYIEPLM